MVVRLESEKLERELAALRADAERYRHLCATHPGCLCFDGEEFRDKAAFDKAIDAARAHQCPPKDSK